ncbi:MAG: enoyl-CoA hydratase [Acidobacteriota bacterium]
MPELLEEIRDGVAVLTMNRPERRNALSGEMMGGLREAIPRLATDPAVRALVLTGAGGAFCAGGDVKGMNEGHQSGASQPLQERVQGLRTGMEVSKQIHEFPKPTIAMIPGPAAGAGLSIALACDLRYAAEHAKITTAFAKVGFSGDYGSSYFLPKLVGDAKARELLFFGDVLLAPEAERLGILNGSLPAEELEGSVMAIAQRLAEGPTIAYGYMKKNLNATANGGSIDEVFDLEAMHMSLTGLTEDHKNAARAFVEKRKPTFEGK